MVKLISFCTFIKNRREHLEKTLPLSLSAVAALAARGVSAEFCILDWGSDDGLKRVGHPLVRWKTSGPQKFIYRSKCKNLAHRMGTGEYLCNLDADNWVSEQWLNEILPLLKPDVVIRGARNDSWGRVLLHRDVFNKLGGHDEHMMGWGYEDVDLVRRAELLGCREIVIRSDDCIPHDDALRTQYEGTRSGDKWHTKAVNQARSKKRISAGLYDWRA